MSNVNSPNEQSDDLSLPPEHAEAIRSLPVDLVQQIRQEIDAENGTIFPLKPLDENDQEIQ